MYRSHYRSGVPCGAFDIYDEDYNLVGTLPENATDLEADEEFDPNTYPWEDSPHFIRVDEDGDVIPNG
jgi:hypothetical protein